MIFMIRVSKTPQKFLDIIAEAVLVKNNTDFMLSIEKIRKKAGAEKKYKNYADLKKRVIIPAANEFNREFAGIANLECKEIKAGRKITALHFKVNLKEAFQKTAKLTIEIPLIASLKINRIVDEKRLEGKKYSKQKFLTETILEALGKYKL